VVWLLVVGSSIWLAVAGLAYALAVAAGRGDAVDEAIAPAAPSEIPRMPLRLAVCPSCLAVIERRPAHEACPACGDGLVTPTRRSTFARIPS
jgi:hypothetical protein